MLSIVYFLWMQISAYKLLPQYGRAHKQSGINSHTRNCSYIRIVSHDHNFLQNIHRGSSVSKTLDIIYIIFNKLYLTNVVCNIFIFLIILFIGYFMYLYFKVLTFQTIFFSWCFLCLYHTHICSLNLPFCLQTSYIVKHFCQDRCLSYRYYCFDETS